MQITIEQQPQREFRKVESSSSIRTAVQQASHQGCYKKYTKITNDIKTKFLDLIINGNCSIKKAAQELNINYSSAKTIISAYREKNRKKFKGLSRFHKRASFRDTQEKDQPSQLFTLNTSIGGVEVSTTPIELGRHKLIKKLKVVQIISPTTS